MFDSKEVEWSDIDLFINGIRVAKVQDIRYKKTQEKELLHAAGNEPGGIQKGNKIYGGTMTLLKGAVDVLNAAAIAAGGEDILDVEYTITAVYKPRGIRPLMTDTLVGVEITEYELGMAQNDKSMKVSLPFLFLRKI